MASYNPSSTKLPASRRSRTSFGEAPAEIISEPSPRLMNQDSKRGADRPSKVAFLDDEFGWCINFIPGGGILVQMEALKVLKEEHPDAAIALATVCERMVKLAAHGELESLKACCREVLGVSAWKGQPPPLWYVCRMLRECAPEAHLPCVRWLLKGGGLTPRAAPPLHDLMHLVVERSVAAFTFNKSVESVDKGFENSAAGNQVLAVLSCLCREGKFDPSAPRKKDGWTPLHVACSKNLLVVVRHLVSELGADVNAVSLNDTLPLGLADRVADLVQSRHRIEIKNFERLAERQRKKNIRRVAKEKQAILEASEARGEVMSVGSGSNTRQDAGAVESETSDEEDSDESDEDRESGSPPLPPVPPPAVTPLQEFLLAKGARRTWRREPAVQNPAPKPAARSRFSGFAGEASTTPSHLEAAEGTTTLPTHAAAGAGVAEEEVEVEAGSGGGFSFCTD